MWTIKNGILYKDNKPIYAIGLSYYPSYREDKVPVPPDGDRVGEMKKDIRQMKECGFNIVRFAALGEVKREKNTIVADTDFVDKLMREAELNDISVMLRLQGYTMNLSSWEDCYMLDQNGEQIDRNIWFNFIQNSLHHKGILKDNEEGTAHLAKHYLKYKNLVSFQTYNEPHYPLDGEKIYDYHPETIKAFRKYLAQKGIFNANVAEKINPPTHRPYTAEERNLWAEWRVFSKDSLSDFLSISAQAAKKVDESIASCTCLTTTPVRDYNSVIGVDFYDNARDMDFLGITHYIGTNGSDFFIADFAINFTESAASNYGKHCWLVEYDARTDIPDRKLNEETYMALGCGFKGIMYYQWRGDCPMPTSPEGNGFGFLNYDGTKALNYDNGMTMVNFLNRISDKLVNAEKVRTNVGIIYSNYAVFMADTATEKITKQKNNTIQATLQIYEKLKRKGISADIVIPEALTENNLNIKWLFVPEYDLLSSNEKDFILDFEKKGGKVFVMNNIGFRKLSAEYGKYNYLDTLDDIFEENNIIPSVEVLNSTFIMTNIIKGNDYYLISVNNIKTKDTPVENVQLKLNIPAKKVAFMTSYGDMELDVNENIVKLPPITDGGMLYVE